MITAYYKEGEAIEDPCAVRNQHSKEGGSAASPGFRGFPECSTFAHIVQFLHGLPKCPIRHSFPPS